jgi:hypothetical protein
MIQNPSKMPAINASGFRRDYHLIQVSDYNCWIQTKPAWTTGSAIMVVVWLPPEATPAKYDDNSRK